MTKPKRGTKRARLNSRPRPSLLSLPDALLELIAHKAGPRSRQLCKGLASAYGPLRTFRPPSIPTLRQLNSILRSKPHLSSIHSADLRSIRHLITDRSLPTLTPHFPSLLSLHLSSPRITPRAIPALPPTLTRLHLTSGPPIDPLTLHSLATHLPHLRSLTLPETIHQQPFHPFTQLTQFFNPLSSFTALHHLAISDPLLSDLTDNILQTISHLPTLSSLHLCTYSFPTGAPTSNPLQPLTNLTQLHLNSFHNPFIGPPVAPHLSILTALAHLSLSLSLILAEPCDFLAPLTALTHLSLNIDTTRTAFDQFDPVSIADATALYNRIFSTATALPRLAHLSLASECGSELNATSLRHLQSLPPTLTHLTLRKFSLPPTPAARALSRLPSLASLGLFLCRAGGKRPGELWGEGLGFVEEMKSWTSLTNLKELMICGWPATTGPFFWDCWPALKGLTSLSLGGACLFPGRLKSIGSELKGLRRLELCDCVLAAKVERELRELRLLSELEELDLSESVLLGDLRRLVLPASLRRLWLLEFPDEGRAEVEEVLGGRCEVMFEGEKEWGCV